MCSRCSPLRAGATGAHRGSGDAYLSKMAGVSVGSEVGHDTIVSGKTAMLLDVLRGAVVLDGEQRIHIVTPERGLNWI